MKKCGLGKLGGKKKSKNENENRIHDTSFDYPKKRLLNQLSVAQRKRIQRIQWIHRERATATHNVFTKSKKSYILIFSSSNSSNSRSEIFRNKRICDHSEHDEWMCTFFYSYFVHLNICAIWMCKYNSWRVKIMTIKIVRCQIYPWQSVQIARCWILTLFISLQLFSGHWTLTITSFGTANKKHQRKKKTKSQEWDEEKEIY